MCIRDSNEGASVGITVTDLSASDVDTADAALVYTITSAPANGQVRIGGVAVTSFTQEDLVNGLVEYVHDGSDTVSDTFTFELSDGTTTLASSSFDIVVNAVDDAPQLDTNTGVTVAEEGVVAITTAELSASDPDTADADIIYPVSGLTNGQIEVGGTASSSFTQEDLVKGIVE